MTIISVTIDVDLEVDLGIVRQNAQQAGVSVERYLEDEPGVWWHLLEGSDPRIQVGLY